MHERQHQEAALDRDAEDDQRQRGQDEEIDHADGDVGELLSEQVLEPPRRRDVEVDHRAQLLFAHDADRHENRRYQEQQQRRDARHDRVDALERRVVHVPLFDIGRVLLRRGRSQSARGIPQHGVVHALHVLLDGIAAERHGAVHLRQDLRSRAPAEISAEIRRNLEDHRDVVRLQPLEGFVGGAGRRSAR